MCVCARVEFRASRAERFPPSLRFPPSYTVGGGEARAFCSGDQRASPGPGILKTLNPKP